MNNEIKGQNFEIVGIYINSKSDTSNEFGVNFNNMRISFNDKYEIDYNPDSKILNVTISTINSYKDCFYSEYITSLSAIVGKNGSGKTTILKCLSNISDSDAIEYFVVLKYDSTIVVEDKYGLCETLTIDGEEMNHHIIKHKGNLGDIIEDPDHIRSSIIYFQDSFGDQKSNYDSRWGNIITYATKRSVASLSFSRPRSYKSLLELLNVSHNNNNILDTFIGTKKLEVLILNGFDRTCTRGLNNSYIKIAKDVLYEFFKDHHRIIEIDLLFDKTETFYRIRVHRDRFILDYLYYSLIANLAAIAIFDKHKSIFLSDDFEVQEESKSEIELYMKDIISKNLLVGSISSGNYEDLKDALLDCIKNLFGVKIIEAISNEYPFKYEIKNIDEFIYIIESLPKCLFKNKGLVLFDNKNRFSKATYNKVSQFIEFFMYDDIGSNPDIVKSEWWNRLSPLISNMSSGEKKLLSLLASIKSSIHSNNEHFENTTIVIDEPDNMLHLEWSRIFLKNLFDILTEIGKEYNQKFQVIFATHSPIMLSDVLSSDVIRLYVDEEENVIYDNKDNHKTFAGNLFDLINDSFYLETTTGEFAKSKIKEKFSPQQGDNFEYKELEYIINEIGEPVVAGYLRKMIENKRNEVIEEKMSEDEIRDKIEHYQKMLEDR